MFNHYRTQGIVLERKNIREADQYLTVFTRDFGKLKILAKGMRKIRSKLRSGIDFFYLSEVEFIQGKAYKTLTDAVSIENFRNIKKSPGRLKIAYQIVEILDKIVREEKDEKIWNLLKEVFIKLNSREISTNAYWLIPYYFFWNFASVIGYRPELYRCVLCRKKLLPSGLSFSAKDGGVICENCFSRTKSGRRATQEIVKIL